jgi:hypothetical protein
VKLIILTVPKIHLFILSITSWIPLFPNAIGALVGGGMLAYLGCSTDAVGDLLRY